MADLKDPSNWVSELGKRADAWKHHLNESADKYRSRSIENTNSGWKKATTDMQTIGENQHLNSGEPHFSEAERNGALSNRNNLFAHGMTVLKTAGKIVNGYSYAESVDKIITARDDQREKIMYEEGFKHFGEFLGTTAGTIIMAALQIEAPIVSIPLGISITISLTHLGGENGKVLGDKIYEIKNKSELLEQDIIKRLRN